MTTPPVKSRDDGDRIPETPLFDRARAQSGYELNKMANGLSRPENRAAFVEDEAAYMARFDLTDEQKAAVSARDWQEMVRLGGNLFYILKISAVDPVPITAIGAAQAGMAHEDFLTKRLGKKPVADQTKKEGA
ncbi:extradiol ring-cleavage dioxygenase [Breoghania sp.]|uniref:extradiol ring-cleavage dioxygenase n=1 Tax=Breoghania sp. TaxID=2065378 RepID=UPI002AA695AC|nr:extradiol ring-cleavage dioxygenase [Breoghania sp.]